MPLPQSTVPAIALQRAERREDVYDYSPALRESRAVEWHVNFADPNLFVAYGSGLFAQDEMQVAEHPVLGALKEALISQGNSARTEENGRPTPILITGAERLCRVATDWNAGEGRPRGLYGNAFAAASAESVRRATTRIDPPTVTNLISISAPSGGFGRYQAAEVERILKTAYTGFRAAVLESGDGTVAVHTGFWGCGAFGGHRVLMALLQVIAAGMADVHCLIFHTYSASGSAAFDTAQCRLETLCGDSSMSSRDLVERITTMGLEWGVSDGN